MSNLIRQEDLLLFSIFHIASKSFLESFTDEITSCQFIVLIAFMYSEKLHG